MQQELPTPGAASRGRRFPTRFQKKVFYLIAPQRQKVCSKLAAELETSRSDGL